VVFVIGLFAALSLIAKRSRAVDEANSIAAQHSWTALALAALALMAVPIGTWTASHVITPPPYRIRYVFPCTAAWVFITALALIALHRLPAEASGRRWGIPSWCCDLVLIGVVGFCLGFQDLRAYKNAERAPMPYVDDDYGYKDLPMVFENSWPFVHRAVYSNGQRQYVMVIDHDAAEADPGWYTKNMEREFKNFAPRYGKAVVSYYDNLPNWPDGFLAVDDDYTKTWEWIFAHHPELKPQLLGTRMSDPDVFGQQRTYLVRKANAAGDSSQNPSPKPQ
jgi:hypothetical protein